MSGTRSLPSDDGLSNSNYSANNPCIYLFEDSTSFCLGRALVYHSYLFHGLLLLLLPLLQQPPLPYPLSTFPTTTSDIQPALPGGFGHGELCEGLSICRVDTHQVIEVFLGGPQLYCQGKALSHLTRIGAHEVEADDAVVLRRGGAAEGSTETWTSGRGADDGRFDLSALHPFAPLFAISCRLNPRRGKASRYQGSSRQRGDIILVKSTTLQFPNTTGGYDILVNHL